MGLRCGRSWKGCDPWIPGLCRKGTDRSQSVPTQGGRQAQRALLHCSAVTGVQCGLCSPKLLQTGPDGPRSGCSSVAAAGLGDNAGEQFQVPHLPCSTLPFG